MEFPEKIYIKVLRIIKVITNNGDFSFIEYNPFKLIEIVLIGTKKYPKIQLQNSLQYMPLNFCNYKVDFIKNLSLISFFFFKKKGQERNPSLLLWIEEMLLS